MIDIIEVKRIEADTSATPAHGVAMQFMTVNGNYQVYLTDKMAQDFLAVLTLACRPDDLGCYHLITADEKPLGHVNKVSSHAE